MATTPAARLGGSWASGLLEVTDDLARLDSSGRWAVAIPYRGAPVLARFASWQPSAPSSWAPTTVPVGRWRGPSRLAWRTSMDKVAYTAAVESIRQSIATGDVYQANVCRVMSAALPDPAAADVAALHALLEAGNPAPYGGFLRLPDLGVHIAGASPELFVSVVPGGQGRVVRSGPIKGTARVAAGLSPKDAAENVMIVDLVRNDLSIVAQTGSVTVPQLLEVQEHPGLVHLVSYVEALLRPEVRWSDLLAATFPPGSVTGAPKLAALALIDEVEIGSRWYYCGAFGWVDADTGEAELAVSIRTFWHDGATVFFGTGAGITWGSDPAAEWGETELKAARLVEVASGAWQAGAS